MVLLEERFFLASTLEDGEWETKLISCEDFAREKESFFAQVMLCYAKSAMLLL